MRLALCDFFVFQTPSKSDTDERASIIVKSYLSFAVTGSARGARHTHTHTRWRCSYTRRAIGTRRARARRSLVRRSPSPGRRCPRRSDPTMSRRPTPCCSTRTRSTSSSKTSPTPSASALGRVRGRDRAIRSETGRKRSIFSVFFLFFFCKSKLLASFACL